MKKLCLIIIIGLLIGMTAYSEESQMNLYINQIPIDLESPVLNVNGQFFIPLEEAFSTLGAQVIKDKTISTYYLNTFVKIDVQNNYYAINGKKYNHEFEVRNDVIYAPLKLLKTAFDLTTQEISDQEIYLKANDIIQYKNYNSIPYRSVAFEDDGARFSIPLDWNKLDDTTYGYDSNYGRISANFSTRQLNENIDINVIMDTFIEHLTMTYQDRFAVIDTDQKIYNYLTSNVLYLESNVNDIDIKELVHFIPSEDKVYIMHFKYPEYISESFILQVFENVMNTFYIDESSFDSNSEHYMEFKAARDYQLTLSSVAYSNMTVDNQVELEGYFNTEEVIESLTISVSKGDEKLSFYVPVENNSFKTPIYIPFGLGKHNIKIAITPEEQKVAFDGSGQILNEEELLLRYSVVNLNKKSTKYVIPTRLVQSNDRYIRSMSNLLTRKYHTDYSKAKAIYDFIQTDIEVLTINEVNFSARDVYEQFKGTEEEILYYFTALLRAQNIPTRILEGQTLYNSHQWIECHLNGSWITIDPFGDKTLVDNELNPTLELLPGFNKSSGLYKNKYSNITILEH
ncbi:hypothetical protein EZV73_17350 [Acidaminobacter sp. JC074]|uniref:transglutaminase domain-containing protein n=1 Tax=Acidaminobacter sp. JC074 TaxID=2530199 RepID=UPI001F0DA54A|nr:transglutaminase domain-containing protein [Acidaminobacter sp. JC074]MCH4889368.1 hypothetical protein [Acidaminobacter sp. JC074]